MLNTFVFVGAMETYEMSFRIMMALLGVVRTPSVFLRKTNAEEASTVHLTPTLEAAIRAANARDVELYDGFMARLRRVEGILRDGPPAVPGEAPEILHAPETGFAPWRYVA